MRKCPKTCQESENVSECFAHTRFWVHLNPFPLHILSSLPSSLPMPNPEAKSNPSKRLPSASHATLRIHRCPLRFSPVSIHTQFRSSFFLTMVTSRHLSTFSLQTPPSTKMPLLLWLCFARKLQCQCQRHCQQRAIRGCLQINTFHPLPPQRRQFLSTARLRSLGYPIPRHPPPSSLQPHNSKE